MRIVSSCTVLAYLALAAATPALARPGWSGSGWGGSGWNGAGWGGPDWDEAGRDPPPPASRAIRDRSRENHIEVNRFVGDDTTALGHGAIAISSQTDGQDYVPQASRAAYEAAVVDQLVHAGYDTAHTAQTGGQLAELRVARTLVEGPEDRHKPVSGEMGVSVGNHGSAYGMALNVDLSKPLPPLVSTRLEARIRDRTTSKVLWEGRAEVATREGSKDWGEQDIAARLAAALFDGFPLASDEGTRHGW
jgi:hypothetical protein